MPRWLVYSLLTVVCFGVWGVTAKPLDRHGVPAGLSQAFSTAGIVPIMLVLAFTPNWRRGERKQRGSLGALGAGILVGLGNLSYYHALSAGGQASTTAPLTALYPVTTVLLAFLLLRERPGPVQLAGIAGSLIAMYLLFDIHLGQMVAGWRSDVRPGEGPPAWMGYALAPIVLWGVAALIMKVATGDVSAELSTFWFLAGFLPLAAVLLPLEKDPIRWAWPVRVWLIILLLGASYGLGNLWLLAAYRSGGKASVVTPLTGLYPIVTIPLAILLFREEVSPRGWVGVALALLAGVALSVEPKPPADGKGRET